MAKKDPHSASFRQTLLATATPEAVQKGTAFVGEGPDFVFAVESATKPQIIIDDKPGPAMSKLKDSNVWMTTAQLRTGHPHVFHYMVDGTRVGGNLNVPAYGPDSYPQPGVPEGKLSEKIVTSAKSLTGWCRTTGSTCPRNTILRNLRQSWCGRTVRDTRTETADRG